MVLRKKKLNYVQEEGDGIPSGEKGDERRRIIAGCSFFLTQKMGWGEYSCLALTSSSVLGITDIIPE